MGKWTAMVLSVAVLLGFCASSYGEGAARPKKGFIRSMCVGSILFGKPTWQEAYNLDEEKVIRHLKELHINNAMLYVWGCDSFTDRKGFDVGRFMKAAEKHGIRVMIYSSVTCRASFEGLPNDLWMSERPGKGKNTCTNKPVVRKHILDKYRDLARRYGRHPAFAGMMEDEPDIFAKTGYCRYCRGEFQKWLKKNYPERLTSAGIDVAKVTIPPDKGKNLFVHNAYQLFVRDNFISFIGEMGKSFKTRAPSGKFAVCFSLYEYRKRPLQASHALLGRGADIIESENIPFLVSPGGIAYWYELASSALEHWPSYHFGFMRIEDLKLGTWQMVMHADGIEYYAYRGFYQDLRPKLLGHGKDAGKVKAKWHGRDTKLGMIPEKVKVFKAVCGDIEKCDPYIGGIKTAATIAIGVKELDSFPDGSDGDGRRAHYDSVGAGQDLYEFFVREHITSAPFFVENMTEKLLARTKILLLPNCRSLSDKEVGIIKDWVLNGGVLLVSKQTSSKDELGLERKDYALKEVFGASITDGKVKATTAKLIAGKEGAADVLSNDYGKGRCYLFLDGLNSYAKGEKTALLKKILDSGMKKAGARYPLLITKGGEGIETNVRDRAEGKQLTRVFYLLKIKDKASTSGIEARLEVPSGYKVKDLLVPIRGKSISYKEKDGYVVFDVPSFELYEAVVLRLVKE